MSSDTFTNALVKKFLGKEFISRFARYLIIFPNYRRHGRHRRHRRHGRQERHRRDGRYRRTWKTQEIYVEDMGNMKAQETWETYIEDMGDIVLQICMIIST